MQLIEMSQDTLISPEPYFISPYFFEQDVNNFLGSGLNWYSRLFTPGDVQGLSNTLVELLSNRELCRQFGRNGLEHVHTRFTQKQMCQSTLSLYQRSI